MVDHVHAWIERRKGSRTSAALRNCANMESLSCLWPCPNLQVPAVRSDPRHGQDHVPVGQAGGRAAGHGHGAAVGECEHTAWRRPPITQSPTIS